METRKVQMTGGSSLMITLPKEWAVSAGIKKNDALSLCVQPDGGLLISSPAEPVRTHSVKIVESDAIEDTELLYRMLVGSYMSGYGSVEVTASHRISDKVRDTVEKMTQTAIGIEIVEEYDDRMILKDLVDPSEMRMARTTERMRSLVSNMLADAMDAMNNGDTDALDGIVARDNDVDRLHWLVARQTSMASRDAAVSIKMGMDRNEMMAYHMVCRIIERIGDHAVTIAKNIRILFENDHAAGIRNEIIQIGHKANGSFAASLKAWDERDVIKANDCIRMCESLVDRCKNINRHAMSERFESALPASLIAGSLRRIIEYSMDIAEQAINAAM